MRQTIPVSVMSLLVASVATLHAAPPAVGAKANDFSLTSSRGQPVRLSEVTQKSPVALIVLRGYPGYQCPFCNRQVQDFVQHAKDFSGAGLRVVMVYPGPAGEVDKRSAEFLANKNFPDSYEMLLDPDYRFTESYGLRWNAPRETAYPSTFLIGKDGAILFEKVSEGHGDRMSASALLETFAKLQAK